MLKPRSTEAPSVPLGRLIRLIWGLLVCWTFLIAGSATWQWSSQGQEARALAQREALGNLNKDLAYRRWSTMHGGVYVPTTPQSPPNPYLASVHERDITTPSGRALTLMNPAYMIRQVHEFAKEQYGVQGHITSLKPLRPENAPDAWEADALRAFETGKKEVASVDLINGQRFLRLMRPIVTEKGCIKCHARQGYQEGDIRGGISVSVPTAPFEDMMRSEMVPVGTTHGVLWMAGTIGLLAAGRHLRRNLSDLQKSEGRLRSQSHFQQTLLDTLPTPIYVKSIEGRYLQANQAFARLFGVQADEIPGKTVHDIASKELASVYAGHDRALFQAPGTQTYETTIRDPEGKNHDVVFHKATFHTPDGLIGGLIGAVFDITDRKRAEDALRAIVEGTSAATGTAFFHNLVRQLGLALDMKYVIVAETTDASHTHARTLAAWTGNDFGENFQYELKGTPCSDVIEAGLCWYEQDLQRRFPNDHQLAELAAESYVGVPLKDNLGNVLGLMAVLDTKPLEHKDLAISMLQIFSTRAATELARQRAELEHMRLESELRHAQKMEAVGTLATGIAHDFNNLLTAISGYTELAKSHLETTHPSREALEIVSTAIRDAGGIADSLLTFGRRSIAARQTVPLCKVVRDSMKLLLRLLPASIQRLEEYAEDESLHVSADVGQLHQVLMNLVANARDAMPNGGNLRVAVSRETEKEAEAAGLVGGSPAALIEIEDTGGGMTPEVQTQMFDPFFTTKPRGKGTGLGLAMVHGIIQDHHGRIDVQSEPGRGTRIAIRLPCCSPPASGRPDRVHVERVASGCRILLAEDNQLVRGIMVQTLKSSGYTVVDVSSGTDALDQVRKAPADVHLLILDVDLPGKTSRECLAEIRRMQPTLPALLITGGPAASEDDGLDEHTILLRKPFKMSELSFLINSLLTDPHSETAA